jgi:hypothetical protein
VLILSVKGLPEPQEHKIGSVFSGFLACAEFIGGRDLERVKYQHRFYVLPDAIGQR